MHQVIIVFNDAVIYHPYMRGVEVKHHSFLTLALDMEVSSYLRTSAAD